MTPHENGDMLVCGCGDPTCIRGALPWMPCANPDVLIDHTLDLERRQRRNLHRLGRQAQRDNDRADVKAAVVFRASELARRG